MITDKIKDQEIREWIQKGSKYEPGQLVRGYWDTLARMIVRLEKDAHRKHNL